ncbi:hypothetical protein MSKU3_3282 [Komagataeibacter oboediens]|nr:hypothetical protein MSKU3_3282 [Komagataeibacter oboediens]
MLTVPLSSTVKVEIPSCSRLLRCASVKRPASVGGMTVRATPVTGMAGLMRMLAATSAPTCAAQTMGLDGLSDTGMTVVCGSFWVRPNVVASPYVPRYAVMPWPYSWFIGAQRPSVLSNSVLNAVRLAVSV